MESAELLERLGEEDGVRDPSLGGSTITAAREYEEAVAQAQGGGKYPDGPPLTKLHDDEPWFFLRAQDQLASVALDAYADALDVHGLSEQADDVRAFRYRMRVWQMENPDKVGLPD